MYGYAEFVPLTEEEILKRITQEEIVAIILGHKPVPYQKICSPIRVKDRRPGAYFEWYSNKLFFIDFADNPTHRIPVRFIMDFYKVDYGQALKIINDHYKLGLGEDEVKGVIPKPVSYTQVEGQNAEKEKHYIIYKPRPFNTIDKEFWSKMHITKSQLVEDEVYGLIWYKFYSQKFEKWIVIRPTTASYAFSEFKERVKIYTPFPKRTPKWITNCNENDIGAVRFLPEKGEILLVTKSYKDCRVSRNENLNSVWFQNEGCVPSDEIIINLGSRFKKIYFLYDNDRAGILAATKLSEIFNIFFPGKSIPIHLPESLLKSHSIKDPTDLIIGKGLREYRNFLIEKDLYGNNSSNHS